MNILLFGMLISVAIWGIVYDMKFLFVYLSILIIYHFWSTFVNKGRSTSMR